MLALYYGSLLFLYLDILSFEPFQWFSLYFNLLCEENEQGIFDAILRGHIDFASDPWPSISTSAKDLVKKMLRADPKERLSAVEVLSKLNSTHERKFFIFVPNLVYILF